MKFKAIAILTVITISGLVSGCRDQVEHTIEPQGEDSIYRQQVGGGTSKEDSIVKPEHEEITPSVTPSEMHVYIHHLPQTPQPTSVPEEPQFRLSEGTNAPAVANVPGPSLPENLPNLTPGMEETGRGENEALPLQCNPIPGGLLRCSQGEESFCTTLFGEGRECPGAPVCETIITVLQGSTSSGIDRCHEVGGSMSWCQITGKATRIACPVIRADGTVEVRQ